MPSSLSSLLADKLGLSEEHAHTLLERLAAAIRDHADETGVHVSGLGTFRRREGTLTFEPEDALTRRVNQQFEGLEPEAASSPAPTPSGDTASSAALLTPRATPPAPDAVPDAPSLEAPDGSVPGPPAVWAPRTTTRDEEPSPSPDRSQSDDESAEPPADSSRRRAARPSRDRSVGARVAAAVLFVLFLIGAGWLILGQQGMVPAPSSVVSQEADMPAPPESSGDATPASAATDTSQTASSTTDDTTAGAAAEDPATDGRWTLVVASRDTRTAAEDQADTFRVRLSGLSLPIQIRTAETDDTVRHRVIVGEFSSRDAALEAMDEHQSLLPEGVWLLRLE